MKLVLSGGDDRNSSELNLKAIAMANTKNPIITYIPSSSYYVEDDFGEFVDSYQELGVEKFVFFPVDIPFDQTLLRLALKSDIIHLSGGNTFYFLKHLRRSKMLSKLRKFVRQGGVLTGCSAGAILMSSTIDAANYPHFERDYNQEGIKNFKALDLVNFEFCPHYKKSPRFDKELGRWSKAIPRPIYACPDGRGIAIDGENTSFIGRNYCFIKGQKISWP